MRNDDEEDFSGMADYDEGRAAPNGHTPTDWSDTQNSDNWDEDEDDYQGCGDPYCGELCPACDDPYVEDEDQD